MNKKIAIPAIAMFAVTLGLGVISPVVATQPDEGGEHKILICHAAEAKNEFNMTGDGLWHNTTSGAVPIEIDNQGKLKGHFDKDGLSRHNNGTMGDWVINATALPEDLDGLDDCGPEPILTIG